MKLNAKMLNLNEIKRWSAIIIITRELCLFIKVLIWKNSFNYMNSTYLAEFKQNDVQYLN